VLAQLGGQQVAPGPVAAAHDAQVAVIGAGLDEMGEDVLFDHLAAEVGAGPIVPYPFGQHGRRGQPAEAQPGRQRLAHRAGQDDPLGIDALQAPDGVPVVAELGVIVVFDHDPVDVAGPVDEGGPAVRRQHDSRRVLVGGGDQHDPGLGPGERRDVDAVGVHGDGHEVDPRAAQQRRLALAGRVLDGEHAVPVLGEQPDQDREAVRDAARHDDLVRRRVGRPYPAEIPGQLRAQRDHPGRVGIGQVAVRQRPQYVPGRGEPSVARERREVWHAGPQVVRQVGAGRRKGRPIRRRRAVGRGQRRHPGALATVRDQEALGDELLVRGDDDATGHDELLREVAAGGQPRAGDQPPGPDRGAQLGGDLVGKPARRSIEVEMEVGHVSVFISPHAPLVS
jgi:hypothetical protein